MILKSRIGAVASFFKTKADPNQISMGKWGHQDHSKSIIFFMKRFHTYKTPKKHKKQPNASKRFLSPKSYCACKKLLPLLFFVRLFLFVSFFLLVSVFAHVESFCKKENKQVWSWWPHWPIPLTKLWNRHVYSKNLRRPLLDVCKV